MGLPRTSPCGCLVAWHLQLSYSPSSMVGPIVCHSLIIWKKIKWHMEWINLTCFTIVASVASCTDAGVVVKFIFAGTLHAWRTQALIDVWKHERKQQNSKTDITHSCKCNREWFHCSYCPDNKVRGANMGPIWGRQDPGGPHVGPMNLALLGCARVDCSNTHRFLRARKNTNATTNNERKPTKE